MPWWTSLSYIFYSFISSFIQSIDQMKDGSEPPLIKMKKVISGILLLIAISCTRPLGFEWSWETGLGLYGWSSFVWPETSLARDSGFSRGFLYLSPASELSLHTKAIFLRRWEKGNYHSIFPHKFITNNKTVDFGGVM